MQLKLRVILNVKEDVLRDIITVSDISLIEFNKILFNAFGFETQEISTFFLTNDNWEQLDEIKIFKIDENDDIMDNTPISNFLNLKNDKIIYVYDFLNYWTFFIELYDIQEDIKMDKKYEILNSIGDVPKDPPSNIFGTNDDLDETNLDDNLQY